MGYTHYYNYNRATVSEASWEVLLTAVGQLIAAIPEEILLDADTVLSKDQIAFNGDGDEGHETLILERTWKEPLRFELKEAIKANREWAVTNYQEKLKKKTGFGFCKTAQKPYDILVCAVLAVAEQQNPKWISVSSDGSKADWAPACEWASKVLGFEVKIPTSIKEA